MAEITISGARRPPRRKPERSGSRGVAWVRLRHMLWMPILAAAILTSLVRGTPHLRVVYTYSGPPSAPFYHRCDYVGLHSQSVIPADGRCPLIELLKLNREG